MDRFQDKSCKEKIAFITGFTFKGFIFIMLKNFHKTGYLLNAMVK